MITIDVTRLLATAAIAFVAVTTIVWLLRRPAGLRSIVFGSILSVLCMAIPAAVMAFGPMSVTERIIGRTSVRIPAAEPYRAVPPPEAGRRGEVIVLDGKAGIGNI